MADHHETTEIPVKRFRECQRPNFGLCYFLLARNTSFQFGRQIGNLDRFAQFIKNNMADVHIFDEKQVSI